MQGLPLPGRRDADARDARGDGGGSSHGPRIRLADRVDRETHGHVRCRLVHRPDLRGSGTSTG